ncbi:MAG: hypothetical protein FIA82_13150 [Melioribacter sp.]|nr:hypothetical protein [Melioribacter sp.]
MFNLRFNQRAKRMARISRCLSEFNQNK